MAEEGSGMWGGECRSCFLSLHAWRALQRTKHRVEDDHEDVAVLSVGEAPQGAASAGARENAATKPCIAATVTVLYEKPSGLKGSGATHMAKAQV